MPNWTLYQFNTNGKPSYQYLPGTNTPSGATAITDPSGVKTGTDWLLSPEGANTLSGNQQFINSQPGGQGVKIQDLISASLSGGSVSNSASPAGAPFTGAPTDFATPQQQQQAEQNRIAQNIVPSTLPPTGTNYQSFQQGHQAATDAGVKSPSDYSGASSMFNQYMPSQQQPSQIDNFISQDPYLNATISAYQQYMSQENQRTSLVDTYNTMLKDSGIQGIDTDLLNMKNVIDGTEDDIRTEVTKAGGFATDSQVIALSNARNKQLIKNYNSLLETRNTKQQYLDTMMNLTQEDRQAADQKFETQLNFGLKISELNQTMKQNAIDTLDRTAKTIGWDGVYQATQGNPQMIAQIEKTYGLPAGSLAIAAQRDAQIRVSDLKTKQLDQQYKQGQVDAQGKPIEVSAGVTLFDPKTGKAIYTAPTNKQIDTNPLSPKSVFTNTQLNKGASNAGIAIEEFKNLPDDSKNYYINSYAEFSKALDNVVNGKEDAQTVINQIHSDTGLTPDVKANLVKKLQPYVKQSTNTNTSSNLSWWNPLNWGTKIYDATHQ